MSDNIVLQNIFGFANPDTLNCKVTHFIDSHKKMTISVFDPETQIYSHLIFGMVSYFSGPMGWTGANCKLGSSAESLAMATKLRLLPSDIEQASEEILEPLLRMFKLYLIYAVDPECEIRILAAHAAYSNKASVV